LICENYIILFFHCQISQLFAVVYSCFVVFFAFFTSFLVQFSSVVHSSSS